MLDIDYFKKINDSHGHLAGDQCLSHISKLLKEFSRASDYVFRMGGEEFLILITDCEKIMPAMLAEKIRHAVEEHVFRVNNITLRKTLSIGSSIFPDDTESFWECVKFADIAMYKAKEAGRNQVINFEESMWEGKE